MSDEPAERTRQKLLEAAQALVEEHKGVSVALDMTMEDVRLAAGVSRSTMYRVWSTRNDFELDVMRDLAGPSWQGTAAFDEETVRLAFGIVAERLQKLATPEGRAGVLREAVRRAAQRNFEAVIESPQWRTYVALTATVRTLSHPETSEAVLEALRQAESNFIERMATFYGGMAQILGYRLRNPDVGFAHLAAVGAAVVEGMGLRHVIAQGYTERLITLDGPGGPEEWHLAALGFYAILNQLIEPDPDYDFPTALEAYVKSLGPGPFAAE